MRAMMQLFLTDSDFYLDIEVEDVAQDEEQSYYYSVSHKDKQSKTLLFLFF